MKHTLRHRRPRSQRLQLEALENRTLLSTLTVDRLTDLGQGQGRTGDLRYCITNATSGDDIAFGVTGTINLTSPLPSLTKSINIDGPGPDAVTIQPQTGGVYSVFAITDSTTTVSLSGLTIANALVNSGGGAIDNRATLMISKCHVLNSTAWNGSGGGVSNSGSLIINDSTFSGNLCSHSGGAVYSGGIALTINNCVFSRNSSYGNGGAIDFYTYSRGQLTLTNCTFANNTASFNGGALSAGSTVTIAGCVFSGNHAESGGGVFISEFGTITVNATTFSDNVATMGSGGAYEASSSGSQSLSNSTIANNQATQNGGGIDANYAPTTINNCTLSGNSAGSKGGGVNGSGTITSSTIFGNSATFGGGLARGQYGPFTITDSTIAGNTAKQTAGGILGDEAIQSTIVADNIAAGVASDISGSLFSLGHNLISSTLGARGFIATDVLNVEPLLGPLQDNGGPTQTMALLPGSPALAAGDPTHVPATDQRGFPRIVNGTVDIGAFEVQIGPAVRMDVNAPSSAAAGTLFNLVITVFDAYGRLASGYTDTVTFTSTDPYPGVFPPDYTFTAGDQGTHTFAGLRLFSAGTQTLTASDTASNGIFDSATIAVNGQPANHFLVGGPPSVVSGTPFDVGVSALDPYGNVDTNYTGTVTFVSTDTAAGVVLPGNYSFTRADAGIHAFSGGARLLTAGSQTITATDTISGIASSAAIMVTSSAPPADHFLLTAPATAVAGNPFAVIVTALNSQGQIARGYAGTVTFSSTDPYPGMLPSAYTFTQGDNGAHTFAGVTFFTAAGQTLTAQDSGTSSILGVVTLIVHASSANHLLIAAPPTAVAGTPFSLTVSLLDPYGNVDTGYTGTVTVTSSDRNLRPSAYTLTGADNGTHVFDANVFTAGAQTLTARDAVNASLSGSAIVAVAPAPANHFLVTAPTTAISGIPFNLIITALDLYGNTDTNFQGTATFSSTDSDPGVILPATYTFQATDSGTRTFPIGVTLVTPADQMLTATDPVSDIAGNAPVTVVPSPVPPPSGSTNKPSKPGIEADITPVRSVQLGPQVAAVDQVFASRSRQGSVLMLARSKHEWQAEADWWVLGTTGRQDLLLA